MCKSNMLNTMKFHLVKRFKPKTMCGANYATMTISGRKCFEVAENSRSFLLKGLGFNSIQECVSVCKERSVSRVSFSAAERR